MYNTKLISSYANKQYDQTSHLQTLTPDKKAFVSRVFWEGYVITFRMWFYVESSICLVDRISKFSIGSAAGEFSAFLQW